jgi:hypothetical protein
MKLKNDPRGAPATFRLKNDMAHVNQLQLMAASLPTVCRWLRPATMTADFI